MKEIINKLKNLLQKRRKFNKNRTFYKIIIPEQVGVKNTLNQLKIINKETILNRNRNRNNNQNPQNIKKHCLIKKK